MKQLLLCLALFLSQCCFTGGQLFGAKKVTIKTMPSEAKIYVDGVLVGAGSYQVKFDRNTDFFLIKVEAPGYETLSYRLSKSYDKKTILYTLPEDEIFRASSGSEDGVDLANRWFDVTCRKGMTEDAVWKRLMSVATNYFDNVEVRDKAAGWIKTAWRVTKSPYKTARTRLEVRMSFTGDDVITYRARIAVQIKENDCRGENCYKAYDRVLRTYDALIQELQTSVGGGE